MTTPIDLTRLAPPTVVEVIDFETIYASRKARMIALYPASQQAEIAATLQLESEPLARLLQENTFREVLLRQRINDAARAIMLAYAVGPDLDHLGARDGVERLTLTPADEENGIPAVMEDDTDYRYRIQLAPESLSVAGPEGAYKSLALKADPRVLDASVDSPTPGVVLLTVLSRVGNGVADADLLAIVKSALSGRDVRPLTDELITQSAEIKEYQVKARLYTFPGPDSSVVLAEANKKLAEYLADCHRLGREVVISSIHAALTVPGIERVELELPVANIPATKAQAPNCTGAYITYGGVYGN